MSQVDDGRDERAKRGQEGLRTALEAPRRATGSGGDELADWIAAECELRARVNGDHEPTAYAAESKVTQMWRPGDPIWRREAPQGVGSSNGESSRS